MSALPTVNVDLKVNTADVAPSMRKAERQIADSASRISQLQSGLSPFASQVGLGGPVSMLGGFAKFGAAGMGAGALGLGMAAPGLAADTYFSRMAAASAGASKALEQFVQTGQQTMAANSVILKRLAEMEQVAAAAQQGGFWQSFWTGLRGTGERGRATDTEMMTLKLGWQEIAGFAGASLGGESLEMATLQGRLSIAGEREAKDIEMEMAKLRQREALNGAGAGLSDTLSMPVLFYKLFVQLKDALL